MRTVDLGLREFLPCSEDLHMVLDPFVSFSMGNSLLIHICVIKAWRNFLDMALKINVREN